MFLARKAATALVVSACGFSVYITSVQHIILCLINLDKGGNSKERRVRDLVSLRNNTRRAGQNIVESA